MVDDITLDPGAGGDTLAAEEIAARKHQLVKMEYGADGSVSLVSTATPLPVDDTPVESIQTNTGSTTATAAGGSDDLDSTQISSGKTGQLLQIIVSATVFYKAELKIVTNGVAGSVVHSWIGGPIMPFPYTPSHKTLHTIAEDVTAGLDGFRVTVTNLDTNEAADIYTTFEWDEV